MENIKPGEHYCEICDRPITLHEVRQYDGICKDCAYYLENQNYGY